MKEGKHKKRNNKKNNNKPRKAAEDGATSSSSQTISQQQDNNAPDLNHLTQSDESHSVHEIHSNGISDTPVENNGNDSIGSNGSILAAKDQQGWIKEEARLKVMIKELQLEMESRIQKEVETETKLSNLQGENDVLHQKEVKFEEKISQLTQEKDNLCMEKTNLVEKVVLLERDRVMWVQEEDSIKQKIAALNDENARLRVEVMELEECGKKLALEKQQVVETSSTLQSRIEDLERSSASAHPSADITDDATKIDELNDQIEAAFQLVEKLITENADLVEKLNELYIELGHWQAKDGDFVVSMPDSLAVNVHAAASHPQYESSDFIAKLEENIYQSVSDKALTEELRLVSDHPEAVYSAPMLRSSETSMPGEIVQIPLDEDEDEDGDEARDLEGQVLLNQNSDGVPITDAPLIGAPFRLISFVAKYVSGADLVEGSSNSAQ